MYKFEKVINGITVKSNEEINEDAVKEQIAIIRRDKGHVDTIILSGKLLTKKQVEDIDFNTSENNHVTTVGALIEQLNKLPKDMSYEEMYGMLGLDSYICYPEKDTAQIETKLTADE